MPDLSIPAVHRFWKEYEDPIIYRVITFMEGVENWTLDNDPTFESAMKQLGESLDNIGDVDMNELGKEEMFIRIACNIKTGRGLRLLQAIDTAHPGAASKLLVHAEENSEGPSDPPGIFLRRNIVFERLRLLTRVFAPHRFTLILRALEGDEH